jgi:hypothetical protein
MKIIEGEVKEITRKESLSYLPILRSVQSTSDEKEAPNADGTALTGYHTKKTKKNKSNA